MVPHTPAADTTAGLKPSAHVTTRPPGWKPPAMSPTPHLFHPLPPGPHHQLLLPSQLWYSPTPSQCSPPEVAPSLFHQPLHLCPLQLFLPPW